MMETRRRKKSSLIMRTELGRMTRILKKQLMMGRREQSEGSQKLSMRFARGLVRIVILLTQRTLFQDTSASAVGSMSQHTHLWSFHILVESIAKEKSMKAVLTVGAIFTAIREVVLLVAYKFQ